MEEAYLVSAVRTPIGRFGGALKCFTSSQLGAIVVEEAVRRANIDVNAIDEVLLGNVFQAGGKGNPARQAAIQAGIPVNIPAMTVNKQCASGLRAITLGFQQIRANEADVIVAGGTESMSNVPYLLMEARWGKKLGNFQAVDGMLFDGLHCAMEGYHMGVTAENLAERYGFTREEQDRYALESQRKAIQAIASGIFEQEIVPVDVLQKGSHLQVKRDENPRESTLDQLSALSAAFKQGGTVTAGNASALNDGAAAVVIVSGSKVKEWRLQPLARIRSVASAGVEPSIMGIGPVPATLKALAKAGMNVEDIDLIELNEAFAVQSLAVIRDLQLDMAKVNVNGGAISLGHPVGCSGARIVVTLLHELIRRDLTTGLATLCVGGGQGTSIIIERV